MRIKMAMRPRRNRCRAGRNKSRSRADQDTCILSMIYCECRQEVRCGNGGQTIKNELELIE
jgi:hypothetical protein